MRRFAPDDAHRSVLVAYAALLPLLVAGSLAIARDSVPHASVVLALVVVIVCAAATGIRWAGWASALSSALWFDWFHTVPYDTFTIDSAEDVQVAVLLLVVGGAVTELALWGARWQTEAGREEALLAGLVRSAEAVSAREDPVAVGRLVEAQLTDLLGLDRATVVGAAPPPGATVLRRDGTIAHEDATLDVGRSGLPTDSVICLPLAVEGAVIGRIDLVAAAHVARPRPADLRVATLLGDQVAAAQASRLRQD